jgi:hypothetical protein
MRAEERWRKPRPSCNRADRGCRFNPAAQAGRLPAWSIITREHVEPSTRGKANERGLIHVCVLWPGGNAGEKAASAYRKGATTGFARRDTGSAHAGLWCGLSRMRRKSHVRF